jgi:hypothetical protein
VFWRPNKKVWWQSSYCWIGITIALCMSLNGVWSPRI